MDIHGDQWPVTAGPAAARHHLRLHRQSAIRHVTHEPEIGGIPRAITPLRRVELNFGAPATLVKDEIERVIARRWEVECLQRIGWASRIWVGKGETPDGECEPIVAIDAEGPVARRRDGDGRSGFEHEVVLVHPQGQAGECSVVTIVS